MPETTKQKYSADAHIAEVYDGRETQTDDIALLRRLIGRDPGLSIFEPFCGTGRILVPLAEDGHHLIGLDESAEMLQRLRDTLKRLPDPERRVRLVQMPVLAARWPEDLDVVLLGGNCFYEVSSSDEQKALISRAASALRSGGHVFLDNDDHQSVTLQAEWQKPPGSPRRAFPSGTCGDGTVLEGSTETAWYDVQGRSRRRGVVALPVDAHVGPRAASVTAGEARDGPRGDIGGKIGQPYAPRPPDATGANVGGPGAAAMGRPAA
jgi:SAM-dependent methyltransferase